MPRRNVPNPHTTDVDRFQGFAERAWQTGDMAAYEKATRARDDARERAAQWQATHTRPPVRVTGWGLALSFALVFAALWWAYTHVLAAVLLVVFAAGMWLLARYTRRMTPTPPPPPPVMVAPPPAQALPNGPQGRPQPLPADVRAIAAAVASGRAKTYLQGIEDGSLVVPTRTADEGFTRVFAPLPAGQITPDDVDLRRYAAALGIKSDRVRLGDDVPGALSVEILDVSPSELPVPPWPALGRPTRWDEPMPLGLDETGRPVTVTLPGRRFLFAGMSGSGKSVTARMIALYAAGDPRVQLDVLDFKGGATWLPLRDRARFYRSGDDVDASVIGHLRALDADMRRRYADAADGVDVIARDGWSLLVLDECQELWPQSVEGTQLVERLARKGREVGMSVLFATQVPTKDSLPSAVGAQADVRVALRLTEPWAAGMVLGGDYKRDTATLPAGHAWLRDGGFDVSRVASHFVSDADARAHVAALEPVPARSLQPVLVGTSEDDLQDTVGDPEPVEVPVILQDVLVAIGDRPGIRWDALADDLGMDEDDVKAHLRRYGVTSDTYRPAPGANPVRGCKRERVEAAVSAVTNP